MKSKTGKRVSILGLPESGKTTFLAALWHIINEDGSSTALELGSYSEANYEHLNVISKRWRAGKTQVRTQVGASRSVTMELRSSSGHLSEVSFPDVAGEEFSRMWERREVDQSIVEMLNAQSVALLINGDTIKLPAWVTEREELRRYICVEDTAPSEAGRQDRASSIEPLDWSADLAPTQVKVVGLLQMLMEPPLDIGERKLAILVSSWDKVVHEGVSPMEFVRRQMPLLYQYLEAGRDDWDWRVWGVSAQGGDYNDPDKREDRAETARLLEMDRASERIMVADGTITSSDLTVPLEWLVS